jgi:hypothetical protein
LIFTQAHSRKAFARASAEQFTLPASFVKLASSIALVTIVSAMSSLAAARPTDTFAESIVNPPESAVESEAEHAGHAAHTFVKRFHVPVGDRKFIIQSFVPGQPVLGFSGGVINWRYNDAGRSSSIVGAATAAQTIETIQAEQAKWTAVCNVRFNYLGTTTAVPSVALDGPTDGVNTIGWSVQAGNQTGVTGISGSAPSNAGPFSISESDIALNSAFNPSFAVTVLHEVGHMLGIDHSDVQRTVMSGPPLTTYFDTSVLTADDIAACRSMYGAATTTTPSISGTITNGGAAVPGITFCTSGGATCSVTNASTGAYSCTVPSGWTGSIHPRAANVRIPAQGFSNVTTGVSRNISAQSNASFPTCNLDIDSNGSLDANVDGVAILRRLLGINQTSLTGLAGVCAQSSSAAHDFATQNSFNFNVTGGPASLASADGLIILRAMRLQGAASINEAVEPGATRNTWAQIQSSLNSTCGTSF